MMGLRGILGAVVLLAWVGGAWAHNQSQGSSIIRIQGPLVQMRVSLLAADYQQLVGLDPNEDQMITEAELAAGEAGLQAFMVQMLRVSAVDGAQTQPCLPAFKGLDLADSEGLPPRYPFTVDFTCPQVPSEVLVRFGLFLGTPVRHVNLVRVELPDRVEQALFSPEQREIRIRASARSLMDVVAEFWRLGVEHIITGYDHLLFLLALLLAAARFRDLVLVVTSFTLAHSVTLGLAAFSVVNLPARVVEPAVALSIVLVALEDAWMFRLQRQPRLPRAVLAFAFGLIHGFGFASALAEAHITQGRLLWALASFNLGVEAGQLAFCAVVFALLRGVVRGAGHRRWLFVASSVCAGVGAYWFVRRLLE